MRYLFFIAMKNLNIKGVKSMTNPFIPTFCEWLEKSGRSTLTIKSYSADVKKYIAFLEANKIEGVSEKSIMDFSRHSFSSYLVNESFSIETKKGKVSTFKGDREAMPR